MTHPQDTTPVNPAQGVSEAIRVKGRDIYECANQLEGYVGPDTDERLAQFLMREGQAAADLADEIVRLTAATAMEGK